MVLRLQSLTKCLLVSKRGAGYVFASRAEQGAEEWAREIGSKKEGQRQMRKALLATSPSLGLLNLWKNCQNTQAQDEWGVSCCRLFVLLKASKGDFHARPTVADTETMCSEHGPKQRDPTTKPENRRSHGQGSGLSRAGASNQIYQVLCGPGRPGCVRAG